MERDKAIRVQSERAISPTRLVTTLSRVLFIPFATQKRTNPILSLASAPINTKSQEIMARLFDLMESLKHKPTVTVDKVVPPTWTPTPTDKMQQRKVNVVE